MVLLKQHVCEVHYTQIEIDGVKFLWLISHLDKGDSVNARSIDSCGLGSHVVFENKADPQAHSQYFVSYDAAPTRIDKATKLG